MEARVLFKLTNDEKAMLERIAEREGRTVSGLLRYWIKVHAKELKVK